METTNIFTRGVRGAVRIRAKPTNQTTYAVWTFFQTTNQTAHAQNRKMRCGVVRCGAMRFLRFLPNMLHAK